MREVRHSLEDRRYRLTTSERTDQGQFIPHFAGKDEDGVRYAATRVRKGIAQCQ